MRAGEPPLQATEREMLVAFLDYYRAVLIDKASGLSDRQLNTPLPPSPLTLGSIVHHLARVEHTWFHERFAGMPPTEPWSEHPRGDWEFAVASSLGAQVILKRYRDEIDRSRRVVQASGIDATSQRTNSEGKPWSMRWILIHMIEETARHAGHADLIRESIDGEVGDFRPRRP